MTKRSAVLTSFALALCAVALAVDPATQPAETKPVQTKPAETDKNITISGGELGTLLRKWWDEGTAAGNVGDYYDNRDREHSGMDLKPHPQLSKVAYTEEQRKVRADWAAQNTILPHVTFGNSSTSSTPEAGGSNVRSYYVNPRGLAFLYAQYRKGQLYIYPEHQDYDPGRNGVGGYGDLYPTNTPYLICSQGSSGSDQPFMRAMPYVLAAFRPEVKAKLIATGTLMPTIQMIFRLTAKNVGGNKEKYLAGPAHPVVFDGGNVDTLAMVKLAHDIALDEIPPLVGLKVLDEDKPADGRDFFEPGVTEGGADTPCVVPRIVRGKGRVRRISVSAEGSADVNNRPLTYKWVVLRGDAKAITIVPANDAGSVVRLEVPWHERFPVERGSAMETNRVDIGVFVSNGRHWSAPGFVTFFFLDDELRTYDGEKIVDVGYGVGTSVLSVSDWPAVLIMLAGSEKGTDTFSEAEKESVPFSRELMRKQFNERQLVAIADFVKAYRPAHAARKAADEKVAAATAERNKANDAVKAAEKALDAAKKADAAKSTEETKQALAAAEGAVTAAKAAVKAPEDAYQAARKEFDAARRIADGLLDEKRKDLGFVSLRTVVQAALNALAAQPRMFLDNEKPIRALLAASDEKTRAAFATWRKRLADYGLAAGTGDSIELTPARGPKGELTRCEENLLARFNAEVLAGLVWPGAVGHAWKVNFVDRRIAMHKYWRDVYRYAPGGELLGWTRYDGATAANYGPAGEIVVTADKLGRCLTGKRVNYQRDKDAIKPAASDLIVQYKYADEKDFVGKAAIAETAPAGPRSDVGASSMPTTGPAPKP